MKEVPREGEVGEAGQVGEDFLGEGGDPIIREVQPPGGRVEELPTCVPGHLIQGMVV